MTKSNENKAGYKHTSIGRIPVDWEVKPLSAYFRLASGKTKPTELKANPIPPFIYPVYGGNGILGFSKEHIAHGTRIVIGRVGENCGVTILIEDRYWITDNALYSTQIEKSVDPAFLVYKLQQEDLSRLRNKGGQPLISQKPIYNKIVAMPSLPEQLAIVSILSTWDSAIEKVQQLIAQKELQKKALMQQLLTGKKRLKGFSEKWRNCHIGEIASELVLKNGDHNQLVVLSCTKYEGLVPSLEYFGRKMYGDDLSTYKVVPRNTFAYATNHIEEGSIGYQRNYAQALISPMYTVFKTNGATNDEYLYRLLKSHKYVHEYRKRMEGSINRRGGLRWEEFSKIKLVLPAIKEQDAINDVLTTADKELELLNQKLQLLKEQKRGLMQKLLTGEVRVQVKK